MHAVYTNTIKQQHQTHNPNPNKSLTSINNKQTNRQNQATSNHNKLINQTKQAYQSKA